MMTLEEAIKHCKDVALSCTNKECALEHFQLLKWLQEYSNMLKKQGELKPVIEMKTPEESLGIDSDTYNKIVDECIYGEQKPADKSEPTDYNSIDPHFFKPTDKVEPKFKVGDWVVYDGWVCQLIDVTEDGYCNSEHGFISKNREDTMRLWTIQDAKPGDVLASKYTVFIFNHLDKTGLSLCKSYCEVIGNSKLSFGFGFEFSINSVYPATKEQRDLLFQKMKESGYEWDSEKLELIKIKQNVTSKFKIGDNIEPIDSCLGSPRTIYKICDGFYETNQGTLDFEYESNWRLIEQKPAWSEEDELMLVSIIQALKLTNGAAQMKIDWLKSLKERILPKSTWSEEDRETIDYLIYYLESELDSSYTKEEKEAFTKDIKLLRSLRPQNWWKPSDEQMNALDSTLQYSQVSHNSFEHLNSLFNDLKKLREE